jgi:pentatricopeptide repeat protein
MRESRLQAGGLATTINYSGHRSPSANPDGSPGGSLQNRDCSIFYPSSMRHTEVGPNASQYSKDYAMTSSNRQAQGKATVVEELKALILSCESGTGDVARHIKEAQFTPRISAFTALLQVASRSRAPEKAVEIFEAMQTIAGIAPNTFSYSALISALGRVGDWQQAERYFNDLMVQSKTDPELRPNTVTYAAMISGKYIPPKTIHLDVDLSTINLYIFIFFPPCSV